MRPAVAGRESYRGFGYYWNSGVGTESKTLANLLARRFVEATSRTVLLRPKLEVAETLRKVFVECSKDNWDEEGAAAISAEAYMEAAKFIGLLPLMLPTPEITPSPNGQIGFEWYVQKNHLLVVTTGGRQSLTYASLYGTAQATSGVLTFTDAIPEEILSRLYQLYR